VPSDSDPKQPPADPAGSGSIDVSISNPGVPEAIAPDDSVPVSSGGVSAVASGEAEQSAGRSRQLRTTMQGAVSGGVERLGAGIGTIGEGVQKLGDLTQRVPLVGAGVAKLGEGITKAGESIHALPRVAQTRRGRLLLRSVIVGFLVVFVWIAVIVGWQVRGNDTPDFRPDAERILVKLSQGTAAIDDIYEHASPRFQEMVRKEHFVDDMTDMVTTVGKFRELTAIHDTLVTTGPTGRVGRVSLTALYDKGMCKGSISFHWDQGQWKFLGIGIELPPELKITQAQRELRVQACADPMNAKTCEIHRVADSILRQVHDGQTGAVWDAATDVFKKQETRTKFIQLQEERRTALGAYKRILNVTEAKVIRGTSATFDVLAEFDKSSGVRVVFTFVRASKTEPWGLRSFKVALPMPRADDDTPPATPPAPIDAGVPTPAPHDAGSRR
jgi:hypothetical protein